MSSKDARAESPDAPSPGAERRRPGIFVRVLAVVTGAIFAVLSAVLGLLTFLAVVYPTNEWVGVAAGIVVAFAAGYGLNRLRRRMFGIGRRKFPVHAIVTTGILAAVMVAVFLIPSRTLENTGSTETAFGVTPDLIEIHTGGELAVYVQKPETPNGKDPILYINGGPGGTPDPPLKDYLQRYVDLGYTTYTFDPIGVRESSVPESSDSYSITDEVAVITDILDHYGLDRVNLIAHSYGGTVAARFIEQSPQRVNAYLAVDTAPLYTLGMNEPGQDLDVEFNESLEPTRTKPGPADEPHTMDTVSPRGYIRSLIALLLMTQLGADRPPYGGWEEMDYFLMAALADPDENGRFTARAYTEANLRINESLEVSPDFTVHLKQMKTPPVLVVHPEFGVVSWQTHKQYSEYFSDVRFVTAPGAEHSIWESPSGLDVLVDDGDALFSGKPIPDEYIQPENPFPPLDE